MNLFLSYQIPNTCYTGMIAADQVLDLVCDTDVLQSSCDESDTEYDLSDPEAECCEELADLTMSDISDAMSVISSESHSSSDSSYMEDTSTKAKKVCKPKRGRAMLGKALHFLVMERKVYNLTGQLRNLKLNLMFLILAKLIMISLIVMTLNLGNQLVCTTCRHQMS